LEEPARELFAVFPPETLVRAHDTGRIGEVVGWTEPCQAYPAGRIRARDVAGTEIGTYLPGQVEVVGYGKYTPEEIRACFPVRAA
jgi:hypothetical protein